MRCSAEDKSSGLGRGPREERKYIKVNIIESRRDRESKKGSQRERERERERD